MGAPIAPQRRGSCAQRHNSGLMGYTRDAGAPAIGRGGGSWLRAKLNRLHTSMPECVHAEGGVSGCKKRPGVKWKSLGMGNVEIPRAARVGRGPPIPNMRGQNFIKISTPCSPALRISVVVAGASPALLRR
eukprot:365696-Chlamydomonas_euryale.AAC.12